ncbi:MAG TPA: 4-hydroxy-3-methylbut-2-enyl diphosphate reductase [Candidatus Hydrogenedentes bacterium]|nr:4-hydroxy-3-methylbut-2-enyl diphosphate reductase [Candidatus Hydrogenedentota bacterium]HIJ73043.1 4-hydroxy-3-methylbut-2-enyl diphosphate reductase [Candidatus Hydrogenedentota bacterium]
MNIILAKPRGFCAGVERAIKSVEQALERYGAPVYVLNDIVHNAAVVQTLADKGAVFVTSLHDVPEGAHLLFSAHGVGPDKWAMALERNLDVIDATCPLVEKVHREARRFAAEGYSIILIGQAEHDEVVGTVGQARESIKVVFTEEDVAALHLEADSKVAYLTQTTLSVEDSQRIIAALKRKFPAIEGPPADDICYATQNRQAAVNALVTEADLVLVIGDESSANSARLAEICQHKGKPSHLIASAEMIRDEWLDGVETVLVTSGASAPEAQVQGVVEYLTSREPCVVTECEIVPEAVHFKLPRPFP